ncbi:MAG: 30S ribosomal protein S8 [Candidatus Vogelbacteria bacterium]|nr:30S ribosomal protein S8 [Candidatus Vogelbacteria bacterium]
MVDPISDMLIRLKNVAMARKPLALVPFSQLKLGIAEVLKTAGYLKSVTKKGKKIKKYLELELSYADNCPKLTDVKRVSKPSRRIYEPAKQIRSVRHGYGLALYSTSRGLLTDKAAREQKVGGELLFKIW